MEDLLQESALARARASGQADEQTERALDVEVLEVMARRAEKTNRAILLRPPPGRGDRNRGSPRQVPPGEALGSGQCLSIGSVEDDPSSRGAGSRPQVDEAIGPAHHLRLV